MARIRLKELEELDERTKAVVKKMESEGKDTSTMDYKTAIGIIKGRAADLAS